MASLWIASLDAFPVLFPLHFLQLVPGAKCHTTEVCLVLKLIT